MIGSRMYELIEELIPIPRSLTGNGVRATLDILAQIVPLEKFEIPSGTPVGDWIVPEEWNVNDGYIITPLGEKIASFKQNPLHIVGYSVPTNCTIQLEDLQEHLFSLPEQPEAIPYVTSYYKPFWGFCLEHSKRKKLEKGEYKVVIDSVLKSGSLTYGELVIPGNTNEEVFFSTYVCHPYMVNNELSGPVMSTFLARYLLDLKDRKYTYRFIWIPETIGAITYLSKHVKHLKENVIAGFVLSCLADSKAYSMVMSRLENTYADKIAKRILLEIDPKPRFYSYLMRGSDERQYGAPGIDLPVVTLCRSKFGEYEQYHTSLDDISITSPEALKQSLDMLKKIVTTLEHNRKYKSICMGEPCLGKRNLYPTLSMAQKTNFSSRNLTNVLTYCDGDHDILDISKICNLSIEETTKWIDLLKNNQLVE